MSYPFVFLLSFLSFPFTWSSSLPPDSRSTPLLSITLLPIFSTCSFSSAVRHEPAERQSHDLLLHGDAAGGLVSVVYVKEDPAAA